MVVGWHSIALVVHWHSVGSGVAKDSYNQILDFSPQWHFIDPQLIKEWKSKCWEWFFPVTGNLIFSSGRGLAQWHSSDRLATLCHWNQCPHFGQSCATQKLHPYYKTTAVADRQPKKVDHFTQVAGSCILARPQSETKHVAAAPWVATKVPATTPANCQHSRLPAIAHFGRTAWHLLAFGAYCDSL